MGSIPIRFRQIALSMPRKRRKKFSAAKEVRRQSREKLGTPPPTRVLKDKRRKLPKHKKKLPEHELE